MNQGRRSDEILLTMNHLIREWRTDEPIPYDLLLLADENRELVDAYLPGSRLYVLETDGQVVGVGVLQLDGAAGEIMTIAISCATTPNRSAQPAFNANTG